MDGRTDIKMGVTFLLAMPSNRTTIIGRPQIGRQYGKNKAAITLQCKLNGKLIAAILFIPCDRSLMLGYRRFISWSIQDGPN